MALPAHAEGGHLIFDGAPQLSPETPSVHDEIHVWVGYRNIGRGESGGYSIRFVLDGKPFEEKQFESLGSGNAASFETGGAFLPEGPHKFSIRLDDGSPANDENTAEVAFSVIGERHDVIVAATNITLAQDVRVEREGKTNVVTWGAGPVGSGFQVWRSNSPYVLLGAVNGTTYTDSGPDAKSDSRYLVTSFTGATPDQGFFPLGMAPDVGAYPGQAPSSSPVWPITLGAIGLVAVAGGAGAYVLRRRRRMARRGQPAPAPAAGTAPPSKEILVPPSKDVLAVQDIRVVRGTKVLVDGVSLRVGSGQTTLLFGPSGSGKSLLLKSIVGLVEHSGRAYDLTKGATMPLRKDSFGYVPQDLQLYPTLSAIENILYFAGQFGIARKEARARGIELLEELGLREDAERELQKLSGGQQRRVSVAAALIHHPRILIMDEPSSGLDFSARRTLWELLRRLAEARGIAVVASTHFIDEAEYASEVGIIYKGKLVAHGSTDSLVRGLPGHGRCVEVTFDALSPADGVRLRALMPQLKKAGLATTASYRLFSARYYAVTPTTTMANLPGLLRAAGFSARSSSLEDVGLDDVFTFLTGDSLPGDKT